ncbi:hypothetical protein HN371_20265 [Candidatus Poribacteria bacterium]|jgi:hypothetical protein|nr:hypothetical protein [Candidatus Poribacteria bacterium]MBT5534899.1 hypothetical protein [Candidatus Poribacteria bacterium]MBT5709615.1 hypothetical protein [Candidatus Poribacteria bacterium]MBT7096474.1 hypothetical protein [Candidatus Poribacteria bacterium]MBT7804128.1 hypothetical protein [Candidatus Poribacteria bacterium]
MWYTFAANCLSGGMLLIYLFEDAEAATSLAHNFTCACGTLVSVLGFLGHRRIWRQLTRSDERIVRLEDDARIEPRRSLSRDRNGRMDALHLRRNVLTRYMGAGVSVVAVVAWAVVWICMPMLGR